MNLFQNHCQIIDLSVGSWTPKQQRLHLGKCFILFQELFKFIAQTLLANCLCARTEVLSVYCNQLIIQVVFILYWTPLAIWRAQIIDHTCLHTYSNFIANLINGSLFSTEIACTWLDLAIQSFLLIGDHYIRIDILIANI